MRKVVFLLLIVLFLGARMPNVRAATTGASVSHGNLIYEGRRGSASLYAADIHLLEEKISTIPERCFDPVCYAHTHNWEYCRINERTHTRHCADCGDANDLTSPHRADSWIRDTIIYEGNSYPAKRFTCACGYQWSMETSHTRIYEAVDEVNHRSKCALDGTLYCQGCEPSIEEHYAWYYKVCEDGHHHEKICFDCGFRMEELCSFGEANEDEELSVCICGRSAEQEESETPDKPETENPSEDSDKPGSEDPPGTGDAPNPPDPSEAPDEPGSEEAPGTGETPETPNPPDASDNSGSEEASGTGEVPEMPDPPGTPDESGTGEALGADNNTG